MLQVADRQLGHITRQQLLALGATRAWITGQVRRSLLIRVHTGVYAVGHVPRHAHCRAMAAVLACGEGAALSHWAAAAMWDVMDWPQRLEVTSPGYHRRPGLLTHRSHTLLPGEVQRRRGVPVTAAARTVLDLQSRLTDPRLVRMVNDLRRAGHLRDSAFRQLCERSTRVDRLLGEGGRTDSALEDLFTGFVNRHRLPMPEVNVHLMIGGRVRQLDALYREAKLIIELDSWTFHSDRTTFEVDRAKDALALAEGYRTVRSTHRRLTQGGSQEAAIIQRVLARSPPASGDCSR
jgi:hypothetical protein